LKIKGWIGRVVIAGLLMITLVSTQVGSARAETVTSRIYRGQTKGWPLDPGDLLVVYYYADGKSCTVKWGQPFWTYWLMRRPIVVITIYCAPTKSGPWAYMYTAPVDCFTRSWPLLLSSGVYKFVLKCYSDSGSWVWLKIL